jgi:quercetin dioxygenase-like cupin family protein
MKITNFPLTQIDWHNVIAEEYPGTTGTSFWKIKYLGDIRIRLIEYSMDYSADHWCDKGHIIYCIDGEITTELKDGSKITLRKGMSFFVGDDTASHRAFTDKGARLFIVD